MGYASRWILAAVILAGFCLAPHPGFTSETVRAVEAQKVIRLTGYTRARHTMEVVSKEAGFCRHVAGEVGDVLGQDGIFAELDTTFIDIDLEKNRLRQEQLRLQIDYYRALVRRYERLVQRELADQNTLDREKNRLDTALKDLELAKAGRKDLLERRARFTLKAGPGWTIIERLVEPGQWVRPGQTVGRAGDYRSLLVPFALSPEEYAALRSSRNELTLSLPHQGEAGLTVEVELERVSPAFNPETRKVSVWLELHPGNYERRGGILAELQLAVPDPGHAVLLPEQALRSSYQEHWLVRASGERVPVVLIEHREGGRVMVRSEDVKPGQLFQLKPAE